MTNRNPKTEATPIANPDADITPAVADTAAYATDYERAGYGGARTGKPSIANDTPVRIARADDNPKKPGSAAAERYGSAAAYVGYDPRTVVGFGDLVNGSGYTRADGNYDRRRGYLRIVDENGDDAE